MNATSMTLKMTTANPRPRVLFQPSNELLANGNHSVLYDARTACIQELLRAPQAKAPANRARVSPQSEGLGAKLFGTLLGLSAIAGTAYGFWSLLERAQNWPVVNAWVGQLLGA
jgi:hypothetical protein